MLELRRSPSFSGSHRFPRFRRAPFAAVVLGCLALGGLSAHAGEKDRRDSWQIILLGEDRIGYAHSSSQRVERGGRTIIHSISDTRLTLKRFGQTLKMTVWSEFEETSDGELLSFVHVTENPPASSSRVVGRVLGKELTLETTTAGVTKRQTMALSDDVRAPDYQERLLRENPLKPGDERRFRMFVPETRQIAEVTIAADDYETVKLHDGSSRRLLRARISQSILPVITRAWLDEEGRALRTESDLFGLAMITYDVPEKVALEEIAGAELDLAVNTLVPVAPLRLGHGSRRIVYRLTATRIDPAEFVRPGDTQQVKKLGDSEVELTVTALPIPEGGRADAVAEEYLAPSEILQSEDHRVIEHARRAADGARDPGVIARRMEKYVHDRLTTKNFSTAMATAAEVAQSLEGDCTEHAVLLAAMLRAEKVPSRIAVGLVYVPGRDAFGGHMWTEAYLGGKWVPLDATLARGGIGAAHIKLGESSFADGSAPLASFLPLLNVMGNLRIEVIEAE